MLLDEVLSKLGALPEGAKARLKQEFLKKNPRWLPTLGPQADAYENEADELFYGGQAGGGKTHLAIGLALTAHKRSLILRRVNKDAVKIVAELPGVQAEDVKISLENNLLTIRGEKRQQAEENNERVHRYERTYGSFERAFALPTTVDPEKIAANYANGVLTVSIPKAERARPREIPVKVG